MTALEAALPQQPHGAAAPSRDVSFAIEPGRCVALVGETGSGKTTIARCIAGLQSQSGGSIVFDGN